MITDSTVDVIIPTYNGLPWLKAAVDSVLSQTHQDLLLYVVDDGSTDKTKQYIDSIKDKRVVYIKKKNGGQSSARNMGISESNSPFVAILDSDDLWYPSKLEKQLQLLHANPKVGMVYGHHYYIDEEDVVLGNLRIWKRGDLFEELCHGNCIAGSASMVLIRREVLEEVGPFKEDFLIGEDWEMWLRIARVCEIDFVPEIIAAIRQRDDGMQQNQRKMADGLMHLFDVVDNEYEFTHPERVYIASYCLFHAAKIYDMLGERGLMRHAVIKLLGVNKRALVEIDNWKYFVGVGIYAKAVFGNPVSDLIGELFSIIYRSLRFLIRLPRRVLRKSYHMIRRVTV